MISCPAAMGIRWVKPSRATESPSCTRSATAWDSVVMSAKDAPPALRCVFAMRTVGPFEPRYGSSPSQITMSVDGYGRWPYVHWENVRATSERNPLRRRVDRDPKNICVHRNHPSRRLDGGVFLLHQLQPSGQLRP